MRSLALLLVQDDITKAMLLEPTSWTRRGQDRAYDENSKSSCVWRTCAFAGHARESGTARQMEVQMLRPLTPKSSRRWRSRMSTPPSTSIHQVLAAALLYEKRVRELGDRAEEAAALAATRMGRANISTSVTISLSCWSVSCSWRSVCGGKSGGRKG